MGNWPAYGLSTTRLHGNGFIQVDIAPNLRLDVWAEELAGLAQKISTPIHDHRFSFRSTVLLGRLRHTVYQVAPRFRTFPPPVMTHQLWEARPRQGEDTVLQPTGSYVNLSVQEVLEIPAGQTYEFRALWFHRSDPLTPTVVTLLTKTGVVPGAVGRVAVPLGVVPDNEFIRYGPDPAYLRVIVREALDAVLRGTAP